MNILMMTNTFTPHVGGVARSVESFSAAYRERGHRVLVVAPEFDNAPEDETDVVRVPAIQRFNGSDFSVVLPVSGLLSEAVERFRPDVVHSHHPFLIGSTALRLAYAHELPLIFTHHTFFERYTHYVPGDSEALKRFVIELSTRYANLCAQVFAPSDSVAAVLRRRGVTVPLAVVPTGVELARFRRVTGGAGFRAAAGLPADAFVVGHIGRLAREKNLAFLTEAVAAFCQHSANAHFVIVGEGPMNSAIHRTFRAAGIAERLHLLGALRQPLLASAYQALDVFAFASQSETQGMVLTEAMAAAVPVVAVDAPGVREVVVDGVNGRLLPAASVPEFVAALADIAALTPARRAALSAGALRTAAEFSLARSADKALALYQQCRQQAPPRAAEDAGLNKLLHLIDAEWRLLKGMASAAGAALGGYSSDNTTTQ